MSAPASTATPPRPPWWQSLGPALISACVVFGPGSLLISSKVGAHYGYALLWLLLLTGVLMGTYLTMGARIGVCGGASPCTLVAQRLGRPAAALLGLTLCLICAAFQFSNNLAVALAAGAFVPAPVVPWVVVGVNGLVMLFLFRARRVYTGLERVMKVMVGIVLVCFTFSLLRAHPDFRAVLAGLVPGFPEGLHLGFPAKADGAIQDPMILVASLLGTTFSVGAAFFQGNLVRERNWSVADYEAGVGDALTGVGVLTLVSAIILVTAAATIRGQPATDIGALALTLKPILGGTAYWVFCVGLLAVAMNPFVINAMIGGAVLADGFGQPARLHDPWPRRLTVGVMFIGMTVALVAWHTGRKPLQLIIFGQALTVLGNPLMALTLLWLANRRDVMGERRNGPLANLLGVAGFLVVLAMAARVLWRIVLQLA